MTCRSELPWLTFDCYDTLVRYSESKAITLCSLVRKKGCDEEAVALALQAFEENERNLQLAPFQPLSDLLRSSLHYALNCVGVVATKADEDLIIEAVRGAEPFPDVIPVLRDLKRDHRLGILSNSEPDIIRFTTVRLGIGFDAVVLAFHAKCYKPAEEMFHTLFERIGADPKDVTHIAQSFYHDMRVAKDVGVGRRIWINRYGLSGDLAYTPDAELKDLSGVRDALLPQQ